MPSIFEISDAYIDGTARLDPYMASLDGIAGHDDEATDYSVAGEEARAAFDRETLRQLDAAQVQNEDDRIARDVLRERLGARLAINDAGEHLSALGVLISPSSHIRQVFDLMPKATDADWQAIAKRLELVPMAIAGYESSLTEGLRQGKSAPPRLALAVADQASVWSGQTGSASYFHSLAGRYPAELSPALRSDVARGADMAAAAYAGFGSFLRDVYAGMTSAPEGVGPDRYLLHCREYSGCSIDMLETYEWGWQEVRRLRQEMQRTADRISPGATPQEAVRLLNSDDSRAVQGVEAYRDWLQEVHDEAIRAVDGVHFDIPEQIKRLEVMIPPPGGALAPNYTAPSEDFSQPGHTWWPTGTATRFPKWDRVSIAYHEGVPGHHLQVGGTRCLTDHLSRYQQLSFISGHGEGWALYSERLMGELGFLEQPDYYLGMLSAQALRCVRVVIDIGLHLGLSIPATEDFHPGERWNYDLAVEFAVLYANQTEEFMKSEVLRYLGVPAQAISYKLGEREWLRAREESRAAMGASFDLKRFHTVALGLGPMGLDMLRTEVLRILGT